MAKVTVLTAVYNAEPYLRQCLDSLQNQTLTDCQFICIDDCSTDASYSILQSYARNDNRFQLLRTPVNSGIAVTRNLGLAFAKGTYVTMLDADDWFAPDTLELAYNTLMETQSQCAVLQLIRHYEEDGHEEQYPIKSAQTQWSGEEAFQLSLDWSLHGLYVAELGLYKRFPYDDTSRIYSDENSTRLHYLNASKVTLCQGRYYYRIHAHSVTHTCNIRRFDRMIADQSMKQQLEKIELPNLSSILNCHEIHRWLNMVGCYWYYYQHCHVFTPQEHQEIQSLFQRMLLTIETDRIPWKLKLKLGYYPFRSYLIFSRVENFYFWLRKIKKSHFYVNFALNSFLSWN